MKKTNFTQLSSLYYLVLSFFMLAGITANAQDPCALPPAGFACPTGAPVAAITEDFEGGLGIFTQSAADDLDWTVDANGTTSFATGPAGDACPDPATPAGNGGNYLYIESSFPAAFGDVATVSASLDLTAIAPGDPALLSFYSHMFGQCIQSLTVSINGAAPALTISGQQQASSAAAWAQSTVDLAAFAGGVVTVEFTGTISAAGCGSSFNADIAIDQVQVWTCAPPCVINCPAAINVNNDPGICGANVTVPVPTLSGPCSSVADIFSENFDAGALPAGWTNAATGANPAALWMFGVNGNTPGGQIDGTGMAFFHDDDFDGDGGDVAQLTSPIIDLSGAVMPMVNFDYIFEDLGLSFFLVEYSADGGTTWNTILNENTDPGCFGFDAAGCSPRTVAFPVPAADATAMFQLRFTYDDGNGWNWYAAFDNLAVSAAIPAVVTNDFNGTADASGDYPVGTTTVTFSTLDAFGNPVTCTTDVTVNDNEGPTFDCPADILVNLGSGLCEAIVNYSVSVTDNCAISGDPASMTLNNSLADPITNSLACPGGGYQTFHVYDLAANGISTDFFLSSVDFGVFAVTGAPTVTVNVYSLTGGIPALPNPLNYANMTLLSTGDIGLTGANAGTVVNAPIAMAMVPAGSILAVELVTLGSNAVGFIPGYTNVPLTSGTTYLASTFCGVAQPTPSSSVLAGFTDQLIMQLNGALPAEPTLVQGLASGEAFPIGTTVVEYTATDDAGIPASCIFNVTVLEFANPTSTLGCGPSNLSLDETCVGEVTPGLVLEGQEYGCFDNYTVELFFDQAMTMPVPGSPFVNGSLIGQTIYASVTDPDGFNCWSTVLIEDKVAPIVDCGAGVEVACSANTDPGSPAKVFATISVDPNAPVTNTAATVVDIDVDLPGATANGLTLDLDISHTWVGDVEASLTSPAGTTIQLFDRPGVPATVFGCANDNLLLNFSDNATNTAADLEAACDPNPLALSGSYQPIGALASFDGEALSGTWQLTVTDGFAGDNGTVNNITFNVAYDGFISNGPTITEGCSATTSTYTDVETPGTCADDYVAIIERTWTVTDASGNSAQCTETITKRRASLDDIVFPANYTDLPGDLPSLSCGASNDPSNTGVPTLCGDPVVNGGDCGFVVDYEDNDVEVCTGTVKTFRTWKVTNWCTGVTREHVQLIKVVDDQGPALTCPANATISTGNDCNASYTIPATTAVDACTGETATITWTADGGTLIGNTLFNAPLGTTTITGTAEDACGNPSTCTFTLTVIDQTPPVPVCDLSTVVNMTSTNPTLANAGSFDSGSYDNCSDVTLTVRRMNMPHCPGNDATPFAETVPFYCCDVGNVVTVELRVRDASGNVNSCMIDAYVDDKLNPAIVCPPDVTLDCWQDPYDLANTGGEATGTDNCSVTITSTTSGSIDECGEGTITRIWTATDPGGRTASCLQKISVINSAPFDICDTEPWNTPFIGCDFHTSADGVEWPDDINLSSCGIGLEPDDLAANPDVHQNDVRPRIFEDACDLVAVTKEDLYLPIVDGACVKVLRTWIVIDWCQYDEDNPTAGGRWEYVQLIKVLNSDDPVISSACTNEDFCASNCVNGQATLTLDATDDCTPANQLNYKYIIDAFNDGGDDIVGLTNNATGVYPIGTHKITWIVEDGCGNFATCMYLFTIEDCAPPVAKCKTFAVDISDPNTQSITLGAAWFDAGSFDLCGDLQNVLVQSPSQGNGQGPNPPFTASDDWTFTCADLNGADFMVVTYDLWVQDMNGNWDYCTNTITLEDNLNVCNGPQASIAGDVEVETGDQGISDVMVYLDGGLGSAPIQTTADGSYLFIGLNPFDNYMVTPERDDTPLGTGIAGDAVTTLDIVKLGMHLLNIEYLDSPYKRIAADVDASGDISIFDMLELRKLVLHLTTEFPNGNKSWRFVPTDYVFPNYPSPFGATFPESAPFNSLSGNVFADFVGIKTGDVNNTVIPNALMSVPVRNTVGDLVFNVEEAQVSKGESYTVDFKASDFSNVAGYQFTLNFDKALIDVVDVEAGNLVDLSTANFGMSLLADGAITTSWNSTQNAELANDDVVFSLTFTAAQDLNVSEVFNISSRYTGAEAYTSELEIMNVALHFNGVVATGDFELYQNAPNPFKEETVIGFNLPAESKATLTIYDVSGKVLKVFRGQFAKGFNQINVNRSELSGAGVLYYQIDTPDHTATKKMIMID